MPASGVTLNLFGLSNPGTYALGQYGSLGAGGASSGLFTPGSVPGSLASDTFSFTASGNVLDLTISAAPSVVAGVWQTGSGSWSTAGNWSGNQAPGGHSGDTAVFGTVATSGGTVTLDSSQSVASLGFGNAGGASFTIGASNGAVLTLANTNGTATISNSGGSHTIAAPIVLAANVSSLDVSASTGSALTIAGSLSETVADTTLSVSGGGALILSGTDQYTGGTTVNAATLALTSSSTLPTSGLLTIGSGGRLVLGGGAGIGALLGASPPISSGAIALSAAVSIPAMIESPSGNMATLGGAAPVSLQSGAGSAVGGSAPAVPEPGTVALLAVAAAAAALRRKRTHK